MMNRNNRNIRGPRRAVFFAFIALAALALFGGVVMLLWNAILPEVAHVGKLSYWQAVGLLILCKILFGGFRPGTRGGDRWKKGAAWRDKWAGMSEEERLKFRQEWQDRCARRKSGEEKDAQ
jgi:hypothetical protein